MTLLAASSLASYFDESASLAVIPAGTFTVDAPLEIPDGTLFQMAPATVLQGTGGYPVLIAGSDVVIEGGRIHGTSWVGVAVAQGATRVTIRDVRFTGTGLTGVTVNETGISNVLVQGCVFDGVTYGFLSNQLATDLSGVQIIGCRFSDIHGDAIGINHPSGGGDNFLISGNWIDVPDNAQSTSAGYGIAVAGGMHVNITGNVIARAAHQGIHIEDVASYVAISGNVIQNVGGTIDAVEDGIYIIDVSHAAITGNVINGCQRSGIRLDTNAGNQAVKVAVTGNVVEGCTDTGIFLAGTNERTHLVVTGNVSAGNNRGFEIGTSGSNVVTGNMALDNTSEGFLSTQPNPLTILADNVAEGNGVDFDTSATHAFPIASRNGDVTATMVGSGVDTPWVDIFDLGVAASGALHIKARTPNSPATNYCDEIATLTWDGTTLTATRVGNKKSGQLANNVQYQASAGVLQARILNTGSQNVIWSAEFDGLLLVD